MFVFILFSLLTLTQPLSIPFNSIIEKGIRVLSVEIDKRADYLLLFNITFLAIDSGHISWGNYSLADQNGNNSTVLPMKIEGNPYTLLNEYPISKGQTYKLQLVHYGINIVDKGQMYNYFFTKTATVPDRIM